MLRSSARFCAPVVIGNTSLGTKKSSESVCRMSDIAQSTTPQVGNGSGTNRISAGDVLGMMDLCACNVARHHITGKYRFALDTAAGDPVSVATIAVDQTPFMAPILNGDTIVVQGSCIHAGKTSVGVALEVFRSQFPTRKLTKVCHSYFSMVAINPQLQKATVVPALELTCDRDVQLNDAYKRELKLAKLPPQERLSTVIKSMEDDFARNFPSASFSGASCLPGKYHPTTFDPSTDLECTPNKQKRYRVPFTETRTEANRVFFPQFLNMNNTIFGGELMRWMEAHAVQCGRLFTANKEVRTLGMYNVVFSDAVHIQDWVSLNAHVVYVHRTTFEVEVEIAVERDQKVVTNRASFVLANFDEAGQPMEVQTGLQLDGADPLWRSRYADARARYEVGRLTRAYQSRIFHADRPK